MVIAPARPALFILLFATVLGFPLAVPFRDFPGSVGSSTPIGAAPARCYRLSYGPSNADLRYLRYVPSAIRLESRRWPAHWPADTMSVYRAFGFDRYGARDVYWWPVPGDSLDVQFHHYPRLRLPARGDTLVGRVGFPGPSPVFFALLPSPGPFAVRRCRSTWSFIVELQRPPR
jgi:hypothetical protein